MNKQDIIQQVSAMENLPEDEVGAVVDELLHVVEQRMKKGEETQIYGFGKFGVRWWRGRTGRDPQTGEKIEIEGRWMPYWTPSPTMIEEEAPAEGGAGKQAKATKSKTAASDDKMPQPREEPPKSPEESADTADRKATASQATEKQDASGKSAAGAREASDSVPEQEQTPEEEVAEPVEQDVQEQESEPSVSGTRSETGTERKSESPESVDELPPIPDREVPVDSDEAEPDWQDIGDEISMKELRFISRKLEDEPEESAAGLFFFDEEDEVQREPEEGVESGTVPGPEIESGVSFLEEEAIEEETIGEEPEPASGSDQLEWAITERKRGKLGWVAILLISFALVAFGAYTLIQEHWPQFPALLSENPSEPQRLDTPPSDDALPTTRSDQVPSASSEGAVPSASSESSSEEPFNAAARVLEPYDFGRARRANFLKIYTVALDSFQADRYQASQGMLERLLASSPPGDYVDNIHYWLGECRFAQSQYRQAVREFEMVFESPVTNKAEDALIMMAQAYLRLDDMVQAREILVKFRTQYPNSQYTGVANQWIQEYNLLAAGQTGSR